MPGDATQPGGTGQMSGTIQTIPPRVSFQTDQVPPAQFVYLQENDLLLLTIIDNQGAGFLNVRYRYLTPDSEIKEGSQLIPLTGALQKFALPFLEGWLLSFGLQVINGGTISPWCFARLGIARGAININANVEMGNIWEGYVPQATATGWPGTPAQRIMDGQGTVRAVTGTTPGAGVDVNELVPTNRRWSLLAFTATLTTGAAVANRQPIFLMQDTFGSVFYQSPVFLNQLASVAQTYTLLQNPATSAPVNGAISVAAPTPFPLANAMRIKTNTINIQGADQWSAIRYLVLEWGDWDNT